MPKERELLFNFLKKKNEAANLKELANVIKKPYKTVKNWRYDYKKYIPKFLLEEYDSSLKIIDEQPDNWGAIKAGKIGGKQSVKHLKKLWGDKRYYEIRREMGKKAIEGLRIKYGKNLAKRAIEARMKKREAERKILEEKNSAWFIDKKVKWQTDKINFSRKDKEKKIKLPIEMSIELAEEIGIHLGDGCLSKKKNYFSVKTNKIEEKYIAGFIFPLYKRLYGLDLKLMELPSVCGFEIYSQAICEFKNKILDLPYGKKVYLIEIPSVILETRNKEIYRACIRGIFDTDGCVGIAKSKNNYPSISFTIKSEKLINQVKEMLIKLGFIPYAGKYVINLNGREMLNKWMKEIGSNNPKNLNRLHQAYGVVDSTQPCGKL